MTNRSKKAPTNRASSVPPVPRRCVRRPGYPRLGDAALLTVAVGMATGLGGCSKPDAADAAALVSAEPARSVAEPVPIPSAEPSSAPLASSSAQAPESGVAAWGVIRGDTDAGAAATDAGARRQRRVHLKRAPAIPGGMAPPFEPGSPTPVPRSP